MNKEKTASVFGRIFMAFMYMILPPAIIACGCWVGFGTRAILPSFLCAFGLDLIVGYIVSSILSVKAMKSAMEFEKERMSYERGHVIGISCAKCGQRNLIPLDMEVDGFECDNCHAKNKVYYEFRASTVMDFDREKLMKSISDGALQGTDQRVIDAWNSVEGNL